MHIFGGVVVGEVWCDFFVLLGADLSLRLTLNLRFPGEMLSSVVSLSVTVMQGGIRRCRLCMCVLCG